jgi:predicted secreted hydrolase
MHGRRRWLALLATIGGAGVLPELAAQPAPAFPGTPHRHPRADPQYQLAFPRDFGAHPGFRTEWWYVTGWLGGDHGFQVTFFRVRTSHPENNPSRFAPRQLLFAHAALMLPKNGQPLHAQRAARSGMPGVRFSERDTDVAIGDWTLLRGEDDRYRTVIRDPAFTLDLALTPASASSPGAAGPGTAPPWLQGEAGFSRKGPQPEQASHYYSRPQLQVSGSVDGRPTQGIAWLDHEWSTTVLDPSAAGWDWTGINLEDGSALVAFRIRRRSLRDAAADARADAEPEAEPLWTYCALRRPDGGTEPIATARFEVLRRWRSPRTQAAYPVAMRIALPGRTLRLEPLFDDQELDGRASTGTVYWEGAVRVLEETPGAAARQVGLGYLELTGYHTPLTL